MALSIIIKLASAGLPIGQGRARATRFHKDEDHDAFEQIREEGRQRSKLGLQP